MKILIIIAVALLSALLVSGCSQPQPDSDRAVLPDDSSGGQLSADLESIESVENGIGSGEIAEIGKGVEAVYSF